MSDMTKEQSAAAGRRFAELHQAGTFLLANVVDAATARALADAGVEALATTSSAHAATLGRRDAAGDVTLEEHADHAGQLASATSLPVNVDAENGFGHEPYDVARCIRRLGQVGAAGAGIEDWSGDPDRGIYDRELAVARIEAAVEAAAGLDRPFVITGRTECLLYEHPGGMEETVARLQAFAEVGAHCLFAPGTRDLATARTVIDQAGGPVNILVPVGSDQLRLGDLAEAGARRISLGGSLVRAQTAHAASLATVMLEQLR